MLAIMIVNLSSFFCCNIWYYFTKILVLIGNWVILAVCVGPELHYTIVSNGPGTLVDR
jgi:hypothetical protein